MGIQGELPEIEGAMSLRLELPDVSLGGYAWWVPGASTAILLLHGWAEDASHLAAIARKAAGMGYHAISISLRGWRGSSGADDYGRSDPNDVARVIAWTKEREGVDRVILLGFSMGGLIALLTTASVDKRAKGRRKARGPRRTHRRQSGHTSAEHVHRYPLERGPQIFR